MEYTTTIDMSFASSFLEKTNSIRLRFVALSYAF